MTLTPQDIETQVFREKFKGYDQQEVDAFLDRLSARISELQSERDALAERLTQAEADAAESMEAERLLKRTLVTAQRTADETVAEAEARAAEIIGDAERRAAELVGEAGRDAEARRAAADNELQHTRTALAELQRFRAEYRDRVRTVIAEQLAMLDRAGDIPDIPAEIATLAGLPTPEEPGVEGRGYDPRG